MPIERILWNVGLAEPTHLWLLGTIVVLKYHRLDKLLAIRAWLRNMHFFIVGFFI